jgi:hypothetical protein
MLEWKLKAVEVHSGDILKTLLQIFEVGGNASTV